MMNDCSLNYDPVRDQIISKYIDNLSSYLKVDKSMIEKYIIRDGVKNFWTCYDTLDLPMQVKENLKEFQTLRNLVEKASYFEDKNKINSPEAIYNFVKDQLSDARKESFSALLLNTKGAVITMAEIAVGDLSSTIIHPREVYLEAIRYSAAAVVFVHNHPSGDPTPSEDDIHTTKKLVAGGNLLGIQVWDHVIVANDKYYSLRENMNEVFMEKQPVNNLSAR